MNLDLIGAVSLVALVAVCINALIAALDVEPRTRLLLAGAAGAWIGLQVALATAGAFGSAYAATLPLIGLMVATPVAAVAFVAGVSGRVRRILLGVPTQLLVALHAGRLIGVFFILLAADGRLSGPFPHVAGWGDILVGGLALMLAASPASPAARGRVLAWNWLGAGDLLLAVTLGTLSFNGFDMQLIEAGVGSDAIQSLPWSLIPTVLVPFYLITHGIVFAQLRRSSVRPAQAFGGAS